MTTGGNDGHDDQEKSGDGHPGGLGGRSESEVQLKLPTLPPIIFGIPMLLGALVHIFVWRGDVIGGVVGQVIGAVLLAVGLWLIYWTWMVMRKHGEHPEPRHATETLVTSGPFARTRNPIYSGFLLIGAGAAIFLNAMALLVAVFFGVAAIHALVIRREEAYLESKFGEVYLKYARRVGRWI